MSDSPNLDKFSPFGADLFGEAMPAPSRSPVLDRFIAAPFSVLSSRDRGWQQRKGAWLDMGIRSEIGRSDHANNKSRQTNSVYLVKNEQGDYAPGASFAFGDSPGNSASVFDPVLCELIYTWFTPAGAQIVDQFAGGSVRGIVASCTKRKYWGCDLSAKQIAANKQQADSICADTYPEWVCGDSMELLECAPEADLIFSCPPYGDLEVYSDNPADLSAMEWHTFLAAYRRIVARACKKLRRNRFACFVVGDFRDSRGFYRDFVSATIATFKEQSLELYNEAILITPVGSAALRVTKQFEAGRKLCKTHQNVLVFCKGDWREAAEYSKGIR